MSTLAATDFSDASVVVTGAGSGIGAALAKTFAQAGARVALADLNTAACAEVAAELRAGGARAESFGVEVGDEASVHALARQTEAALGPATVICVNVAVLQLGRLDERTREELEWQLRVNVVGSMDTIHAYLPQLRRVRSPLSPPGPCTPLHPRPPD